MIGTVAATADPGAGARVVPFAAPHLGAAEIDAVTAVLTSSWIGTGAVTATAEREFANYLGLPHTLLVNSGTAALHLALLSLGVGPGDEVIVPTVTFAASAAAVVHAGARPVLVDVEPGTLLADVEQVRDAVTPRTRAVVAVHVAGCATSTTCCSWRTRRTRCRRGGTASSPANWPTRRRSRSSSRSR